MENIFGQKAIAQANSRLANATTDKATHIKKIYEFLFFDGKPRSAEHISIMTGLPYHAVNRRVSEMIKAGKIERTGSMEKVVNGKVLKYSLYKAL